MKVRDSGMPEETYWESLFDIPLILDRLGVNAELHDVFELGCGYGAFTVPVARRIGGLLTTCDIEPAMAERTRQRVAEAGLGNVRVIVSDAEEMGFLVPTASQDGCLFFNILHGPDPTALLQEAARVLRPGGHAYVIHWRADIDTPRGPDKDQRPRPGQLRAWAAATGALQDATGPIELPPWHWGMAMRRTRQEATP